MNISEHISEVCVADYVDADLALIANVRSIDFEALGRLLPEVTVLIFGIEGFMHIDVDSASMVVDSRQLLLSALNTTLRRPSYSDDFKGGALFLSPRLGQQIVTSAGNLWRYLMQAGAERVIAIPDETAALLLQYYRVLAAEVRRRGNIYYNEIVGSLVRDMLFTLISDLRQSGRYDTPPDIAAAGREYQGSPQALALFHRFLDILSSEPCVRRDLGYYAHRLCVTPKYLSTVCRRISQRTAREWVVDVMIRSIENRLRYSSKSVKEIAVDSGFPNLSSFSKFVKSRLGSAPSQLRGVE